MASGLTKEPEKKSDGKSKMSLRKLSKTAAYIVAIAIFGSIALFTTVVVMANTSSIRASHAEYERLREIAETAEAESSDYETSNLSPLDHEMLQINPDYVGWLRVDGTNIDYPVVRGADNYQYINTSFYGDKNITGSIFMDYRVVGDFLTYNAEDSLPHIIIYGHNLQRGGMFSDLHKFRNEQFLSENNKITLIIHDQTVEFEIFSARLSDVNDPAYFINFNAPQAFPRFANRVDAPLRATQIITLSTCTSRGNNDSRMIVQGYRVFSG